MKSKKRNLILISVFFMLFAVNLGYNITLQSYFKSDEKGNSFVNLKTSTAHTSIVIINDTSPTDNWIAHKAAGLCNGSGTPSDPYIIRDDIFTVSSSSTLLILNSRKIFRIVSCVFLSTSGARGIIMSNTTNGSFEDNEIVSIAGGGLLVDNCSQISFINNY